MQTIPDIDLLLQVSGLTPGRAATLPAVVLGLISLIIGWWALARSTARIDRRRIGAILSCILALTGIILSTVHLSRATGDFGTGSGRLGAIVALVLGLTGMVFSALTLSRLQRIAKNSG